MNYSAEQNVVGALFLDISNMDMIYGLLSAEMFKDALLGRIYLEFQRAYDNGYVISPAAMIQKLSSENLPEQIIAEAIKSSVSGTVTGAAIKTDACVIADNFKARSLEKILNSVKVSPDGIEKQTGELIIRLEGLLDNRRIAAKSLSDIAKENKGKYFTDNGRAGIYTGFPVLDDMLGGLEGGDMIVIGARPAVGKSAFVTQIAANLEKQGKRVGFYNLEMQEKQVYERFVVSQSGIGLTRLRRAKRFLGDEKERFESANEILEKKENIVITTGSRTVNEIRSESRHMGYDVIIIDYLQLLHADKEYRGNRYAEVGSVSRAIKSLAMEMNVPIIALSQLNRTSEVRETKEPTMAELREAGDIEQDASVIILMWNLSPKSREKKGCKVEKQRQGKTGKVVMDFNGDLMQFVESGQSIEEAQEWAKADDDCPFQ
ncbi:DNA helicase [Lachnospiraceae bacterium]|nr:DNA helicase [Lachnospiraceae bacterium]